MPTAVMTSGATFTCPHGGTGTMASGLTISALGSSVTIGGARPVLAGAVIMGFTPALGCTFQVSGAPAPCLGFALPPPAGTAFVVDGLPVYTAADAGAIALVPSTGNAQPGLTVNEPQGLMLA